jgi:bifunctional ADP-heptose synthase (sugar kinase/adenylyltransferase)
MSNRHYTTGDFKLSGKKSTISCKNKLKQAAARQIIQENDVCEYLSSYTEQTNQVLARADQLYRLGLRMDESDNANATNKAIIDSSGKKFLSKHADPIALSDFIHPLLHEVQLANRKFLRSFKLRLAIEEVVS